jgi:hypothetical protein
VRGTAAPCAVPNPSLPDTPLTGRAPQSCDHRPEPRTRHTVVVRLPLFVVSVVLLSLSACGSSEGEPVDRDGPEAKSSPSVTATAPSPEPTAEPTAEPTVAEQTPEAVYLEGVRQAIPAFADVPDAFLVKAGKELCKAADIMGGPEGADSFVESAFGSLAPDEQLALKRAAVVTYCPQFAGAV